MRLYFGFGRSIRLKTLFKWLLPIPKKASNPIPTGNNHLNSVLSLIERPKPK